MAVIELTAKDIDLAYDGWFYTILGAGGDLNEWIEGVGGALVKNGIGTPVQWYSTKGKALNDRWDLTGTERFDDDLTILMFALDGLNVGKLAMFKLAMGDRWFTDIIDNSVRRCHPELYEVDE